MCGGKYPDRCCQEEEPLGALLCAKASRNGPAKPGAELSSCNKAGIVINSCHPNLSCLWQSRSVEGQPIGNSKIVFFSGSVCWGGVVVCGEREVCLGCFFWCVCLLFG